MSDFFDKKEEPKDNMDTQSQLDKIKVGDKEYTQDELNTLVGLGNTARELESKWNTKVDSLMPAFTKETQRRKELEQELENFKREQEDKKSEVDEVKQVEKLLKDQFKVVTEDDFEKKFRERYQMEKAAEQLNSQVTKLAKEIDGSDGRPKFDAEEVLTFMAQTPGLSDAELAYKILKEKDIDAWKERQIQSVKKPGLITEKTTGAGGKNPQPVKVTNDNLVELLKEAMN